jgi:MFS transporter, DHA2 family, multidrug resistance protein
MNVILGTDRNRAKARRRELPANEPTHPASHHTIPLKLKTWVGFATMCIGMFMAILDVQVVATSLPTIQHALKIAQDQMSWIQTAYLIAEIVAIPLTGFLTRTLTMRWLFVVAVTTFTLASIACAASGSFTTLILWRVVQGFSGGTLIPAVFSAVFLLFPFRLQIIATTIAGVLAVMAPTAGPVVGGWITETFSWHWLFLINVLPGIMAAIVAAVTLPREQPDFERARHLDAFSLVLMTCSLVALEIAIKEAPQRSWTSPLVDGLLVLSFITGATFVRRTLRSPWPLVDLRTFRDRNFTVGCLLSFVLGIGLFGSVYLMPVFLAYVRGHSAFEVGMIILVTGVVQFVTAPIAAALEQRYDERYLTAFGFLVFGIGVAMSCIQTSATDYDQMFWPQVVRGFAVMFCILPPTRLALGHLAKADIPDASGLFNMMRNLGGAIGIALIDTVIYSRAPIHAGQFRDRLAAGDLDVLKTLGVTPDMIGPSLLAPQTQAVLAPLIEKVAFVEAINDAWAVMALVTLAAMLAVPLARTPIWRLIVTIRKGRVFVRQQRH